MNRTDLRLISQIAPVTNDEAAGTASVATLDDLAARITAEPLGHAVPAHRIAPPRWRRALLGIPVAAAAVAAVAVGLAVASGTQSRPSTDKSVPSVAAKALTFTMKDGYITVIVKNPYADPSWYNADFKAHHLDITLRMVPVSPSLIGTVPYTDASSSAVGSEVTMIYAKCASAPSGGHLCAVGIKVPMDFHGQYDVDFGRRARPGEAYMSTNSAFAPGEALYGMNDIVGKPVAAALAQISQRHLTAILNDHNTIGSPSHFPGSWYVTDALPYKPGEVMLFVSRTQTPVPSEPGRRPASVGPSHRAPGTRAPRPARLR